jgi:hypothetical protein
MSTASEHAGQAALSICEALLLAMNDRAMRMPLAPNSKWKGTGPSQK